MKAFSSLFTALDETTRTSAKIDALSAYFMTASDQDKLWTIALFAGKRPKRAVSTTLLREWAAEAANLPLWIIEESYAIVGDLAETLALVQPPPTRTNDQSLTHWIDTLRTISQMEPDDRKRAILSAWDQLSPQACLVFNKLITGGFRLGVSRKLMTRALAKATGEDAAALAHRLMGNWDPMTIEFNALIRGTGTEAALTRPYPFCLAHGLDIDVKSLGPRQDWQVEWKWDGIRAQLIQRNGVVSLWSRGEDLITDSFPEFSDTQDFLPDGTVLDGELLVRDGPVPRSFVDLQKRLGRKSVTAKMRRDFPVRLVAYDLLEQSGADLRQAPLSFRREALVKLVGGLPEAAAIDLAPTLDAQDWDGLAQARTSARKAAAEGLMIKRRSSPYAQGRKRGDWWKWKLDPMTIDAVMIYAQAGHGRRATLYTDFTFAVWNDGALVPFAKAYSGLTDAEFRDITKWVRGHTRDRFGPVRQVDPDLVFELAFEGIQPSSRHKSGVAVRFPRILRWRQDKPASEANTLTELKALMRNTT
jgi:DNA ligase-1